MGKNEIGLLLLFFQQKIEWVRLKQTHPDLFEEAKKYERVYEKTGNFFTWSQGESLAELERPERMEEIVQQAERQAALEMNKRENMSLFEVFSEMFGPKEDDEDEQACLVCNV